MKFRSVILSTLAVYAMVGCQQNGAQGPAGRDGRPGAPGAPVTSQGTSSGGGGGFAKDNAEPILRTAKTELAALIRNANPAIFVNLPSGWTPERLAHVIENVRERADSPPGFSRHGHLLMFNYGVDQAGPYIEALRPFYELYASQPFSFMTTVERERIILDVQKKLIHEVHHHWFPVETAEDDRLVGMVAERVVRALQRDAILCTSQADFRDPSSPQPRKLTFIYFRAYRLLSFPNDTAITFAYTGQSTFDEAKNNDTFLIMADQWRRTYLRTVGVVGPNTPDQITLAAANELALPTSRRSFTVTMNLNRSGAIGATVSTPLTPEIGSMMNGQPEEGLGRLEYSCEAFAPILNFNPR